MRLPRVHPKEGHLVPPIKRVYVKCRRRFATSGIPASGNREREEYGAYLQEAGPRDE